jgi:integrase
LIGRYRESSAWATLSNATRRQRENILKHVIAQAGDIPFAAISRAKIIEGRERRMDTPAAANQFVKTMRALFDWAIDAEHVKENPTRDVKFLTIKTEGHHTWTEAEIAIYESAWPIGTRQRLAFDLLLYTGLRRGDAVRLGRQHVKDGRFRISTEKTGTVVDAPILPPLKASIEAAPTGDLSFIAGERGKPMTKESFGNWFREVCEAVGVQGTAHGLRKAGATRAAENGASIVELRAMFGWSSDQMPALYTKAADRARMAGTGMTKLERGGRK